MESFFVPLFGMLGAVAFFSFLAFAVWVDYRKKRDERDVAHQERMKAMELGYAPPDAEIARANAYASAAWAAGAIGLVVPIVVALLAAGGTMFAVHHHEPWENITEPLIVAWSIAGFIMLVAIVRSLSVIRQLPRPAGDTQARGTGRDGRPANGQEKKVEL